MYNYIIITDYLSIVFIKNLIELLTNERYKIIMEIKERVKKIRQALDLSQKQFAERTQ
jgi:DNA-binding transcriptional regulator YiaG